MLKINPNLLGKHRKIPQDKKGVFFTLGETGKGKHYKINGNEDVEKN